MAQGFRTLLLVLTLALTPAGLALAQSDAATAQFVSHNLPPRLEVGQRFKVELAVTNVGTAPWTRDAVALAIKPAAPNQTWGLTRVELDAADAIEPGDTKTFAFEISAPTVPGSYPFAWQLLAQGAPVAGFAAAPTTIVVEDPYVRGSFVSQLLPDRIAPGEKFKAFIQYRNTGKSSWSRSQGYQLAGIAAESSKNWGADKVELDASERVLPGQTATFAFTATAPTKAGKYAFQWQLHQEGRGLFGDATPLTTVQVGGPSTTVAEALAAEFISASLPSELLADSTYSVTLLFKNTGDTPWRAGRTSLHAQGPAGNLTWLIDRVDLAPGEVVEPGDIKAFQFDIHTPAEAGNYGFQWRLVNEQGTAFGDASAPAEVTVSKQR